MPHSFAFFVFFANEWVAASEGEADTVHVTKRRDWTTLDLQRTLLKFSHAPVQSLPEGKNERYFTPVVRAAVDFSD